MSEKKLRAAFAKVAITPEEHTPLQGYDAAANIADPAGDVLDDLFARIMMVDDGNERVVIVSVDSCLTNETPFLPVKPFVEGMSFNYMANTFPEGTKRSWAEAAGIAASGVTVHATHTHSAPAYIGEKYSRRIAARIKEMTEELQPVSIKAAEGESEVSVNRRPHLHHNDALPIDLSLHVVVFETEEGAPLGAMVNCAVHPTLLLNSSARVSSEFVGLAMNALESHYGGPFVSLFIQGFGGDVGPRDHFRNETEDTYPLVKEMGRKLYSNILRITADAVPAAGLPMRTVERTVAVPTREGYYKPYLDIHQHIVQLGEIMLFSTSLEVFSGFVRSIESISPARFTLTSGVANGYCGYLPTAESFRDGLGGYEMEATPYSEKASELFVSSAADLIRELYSRTETRND